MNDFSRRTVTARGALLAQILNYLADFIHHWFIAMWNKQNKLQQADLISEKRRKPLPN